jgi:hypothetical protein
LAKWALRVSVTASPIRPTTIRRFETTATGGKKDGSSPRTFEIIVRAARTSRPTVAIPWPGAAPDLSEREHYGVSAMCVTVRAPSVTCSTPTKRGKSLNPA